VRVSSSEPDADAGRRRSGDGGPAVPIHGLGVDLCRVDRLARALAAENSEFITTVFRPAEIARSRRSPRPAGWLAACFAAKEAVIKSLAGAEGRGAFWQDIEIEDRGRGQTIAVLHGRLAAIADQLGVRSIGVACAHDRDYATACAIASGPCGLPPEVGTS